MNAPSRVLKTIVVSAAVFALVACSGGDNDDDTNADSAAKSHSFAGTYTLATTKIKDSCDSGLTKTLNGDQRVEQNGNEIKVIETDLTMVGTVSADGNSFSANYRTTDSGVVVDGTMSYAVTDTAGQYSATLNMTARVNSTTCVWVYQGTATKK